MKRALWCVLAACGGADSASPDSPAPVQPGGPVTIEVTLGGAPQANVEVMFQNADSALVAVVTTDATGTASGDVAPDGFVTVVQPRSSSGSRDQLTTFARVQPGDALHLDLEPPAPAAAPDTFMLKINADAGQAGHTVQTSCGEAEGPGLVDPQEVTLFGCDGIADMLVISSDDTGANFRSHFHPDVALENVDLSTGIYEAFTPATVSYTGLPPQTFFVGINRRLSTPRGPLLDVFGGAFPAADPAAAQVDIGVPAQIGAATTLLTSSTTHPRILGCGEPESPPCPAAMTCDLEIKQCGPIEPGQQVIHEWAPVSAGVSYSLDIGDAQLAPFATRPVFDSARGIASWTERPGGQDPNYVRVNLAVFRDDIPEGRGWDWRLVAPRDGTTIVFPTLPADREGFSFNVIDGDLSTVTKLTTAKLPVGYDDRTVRERAFSDLRAQITGERGQLVVQDLFTAPE
jgi:hypothetical protein